MNARKRRGAGLLCAVLVLALLVSSAFMIHEAHHDCTGEDCPVCRIIAVNSALLRLMGAAGLAAAFLPGLRVMGREGHTRPRPLRPEARTLVKLKIRLDD